MSVILLSYIGNCQVQENTVIIVIVKKGSVMLQSQTKRKQKQIFTSLLLTSLFFNNKDFCFVPLTFLEGFGRISIVFSVFNSIFHAERAANYLECFHSWKTSFAKTNHMASLNQKKSPHHVPRGREKQSMW